MTLALTAAGLTIQTHEEIVADLRAAQSSIDTEGEGPLDTSPESLLGRLNDAFSATIRSNQELLAAVHAARDPSNATLAALDAVSAISGTKRKSATKGTVTLTVNLNAGIALPAGSVAAVVNQPTNRWVTAADVTNTGGSAADVSVAAEAENTGIVNAGGSTITVIATPVTGWNSVTNANPATPGTEIEQDSALRIRREDELQSAGTSPLDAIRVDLLGVTYLTNTVSEVAMYENVTDTTNADGMPPHSVEAVVLASDHETPVAGMNAAIAAQLWASKAGGIATHGDIAINVTDSQGFTQPTKFRRPADVNVYISVTLTKTTGPYPGDTAVKDALTAFGAAELGIGDSVIRAKLLCEVLDVAGVTDVTALTLGLSASPTGTANIVIGSRSLARIANARIVVTSS
jgi:uncharacterized phage protein gp47/JayE